MCEHSPARGPLFHAGTGADKPKSIHMSLLNIVLILIIVGIVLWLINRFIPMDYKIKMILNAVVVIAVIIWLLRSSGFLNSI